MCAYFAIHMHILCGGIISGYLWIIWLFEGLSGSYLILLSTFPIQKKRDMVYFIVKNG